MELLSPAGSYDALIAAVQNGADAVYLGMKSFGARAFAKNFDELELENAVRYAHERGVKLYVTLNTLVNDAQMDEFCSNVRECARCGVDALIVADIGAAEVIKTVCPKMPLHASTQMTAHSAGDVEYLINMGFSRVVLSRELSQREIKNIYEKTHAELEVFVHGALCICFSGRCLLSSFIGGRSGNKGCCAQPCRQRYSISATEGYFLSPRDLCLLARIKELRDAGAASLKIEGRMKSAQYVAVVTSMYRNYIDSPRKAERADIERLKRVFVRGDSFTEGFFVGTPTRKMMNTVLSNDDINLRVDKAILKEGEQTYRNGVETRKIDITAQCCVKRNEKAYLSFSDGKNTARVYGERPQEAINIPLTESALIDRLSKLGGSAFNLTYCDVHVDDGVMMAAKDINALRRDCAAELMRLRARVEPRECFDMPVLGSGCGKRGFYIAAQVSSEKLMEAASAADRIYVTWDLARRLKSVDTVVLPYIVTDTEAFKEELSLIKCRAAVASTYSTLIAAKEAGLHVTADFSLNIYNAFAANAINADAVTLSCEKTLSEADFIARHTHKPCEAIAYGYLPLMVTRARLTERGAALKDKTGAIFHLASADEINILYNSRPLFMADKVRSLRESALSGIRLIFTAESPERVRDIIDMYKEKRKAQKPPIFTRGYWCGKD